MAANPRWYRRVALLVSTVLGAGTALLMPAVAWAHTNPTAVVVLGLMSVGIYFLYKKQTARVAEALEDITEQDAEEAAREKTDAAMEAGAMPVARPPSSNGAIASESDQPTDVSM